MQLIIEERHAARASRENLWRVLDELPLWSEWDPYIVLLQRVDGVDPSRSQAWVPGTRWDERVRRSLCEQPAAGRADLLQPPADRQAHALRPIAFGDGKVVLPGAVWPKEATLIGQMPVELLDVKRQTFGLAVDHLHERGGRRLPAARLQHRLHVVDGESVQAHAVRLLTTSQRLQRSGEGVGGVDLVVAVGARDEQPQVFKARGQMLQEGKGRLVGPVQILQGQRQRLQSAAVG